MNPLHPEKIQRVLVTGATGNVGRHVVAQLLRTGTAVRALSRRSGSLAVLEGAEQVQGDLSAPETLEACLDGVDAVFLVWPFFTVEAAPAVLEAFQRHARRIVYLSAASVRDDLEAQPGLFHAEMERLIQKSGLEWTFLRPTGFATNTLMWAPQIRAGGDVRWPYGEAARSLIHERDIASVAVRALTGDGHGGAKYVLTGPQTLSQREQVQLIGEAIGRPVRYEDLAPEVARQQLIEAWGSPLFVDAALQGWAQMVAEPERVTRTVEDVTGVPALPFREWAREHAGDFR